VIVPSGIGDNLLSDVGIRMPDRPRGLQALPKEMRDLLKLKSLPDETMGVMLSCLGVYPDGSVKFLGGEEEEDK
jgi:hypothetical protein